jgi:fructosamine-3-kinase
VADRRFTKRRTGAAPGFFAVEAAGLAWLRAAGALRVPDVLEVGSDHIVLEHVDTERPTREAARFLGRGLAGTHRAGAPHHGAPPDGWQGDGFIATLPLPHRTTDAGAGWGEFYATQRLAPYLRTARDSGAIDGRGAAVVEGVIARLVSGLLDLPDASPARLHGDLWAGNVLWSTAGPVVVDPAAHGGNRETDLAMLALFGLPHLDDVVAAYDEEWPLDAAWRDRVQLHQLHPLLVHAALFGGGYGAQAVAAAARYR